MRTYREVGLVVAAAGSSRRYGGANKLFEDLGGTPLFLHSMRRFWQMIPPEHTVLVVNREHHDRMLAVLRDTCPDPLPVIVDGGPTRAASVIRGLDALPADLPLVAIQDAARPLTSIDLLRDCMESAIRHGSGVAARRITDTVKVADGDGMVQHTLDRSALWAAETPQVLSTARLRKAYTQALAMPEALLTDDASALEAVGESVRLVEALAPNPKVTFQRDLDMVRARFNVHL